MPVSLPEPLMQIEDARFARLTADEYQAMTESGHLREGPIELLDGLLVWKDRRDRGGLDHDRWPSPQQLRLAPVSVSDARLCSAWMPRPIAAADSHFATGRS